MLSIGPDAVEQLVPQDVVLKVAKPSSFFLVQCEAILIEGWLHTFFLFLFLEVPTTNLRVIQYFSFYPNQSTLEIIIS